MEEYLVSFTLLDCAGVDPRRKAVGRCRWESRPGESRDRGFEPVQRNQDSDPPAVRSPTRRSRCRGSQIQVRAILITQALSRGPSIRGISDRRDSEISIRHRSVIALKHQGSLGFFVFEHRRTGRPSNFHILLHDLAIPDHSMNRAFSVFVPSIENRGARKLIS